MGNDEHRDTEVGEAQRRIHQLALARLRELEGEIAARFGRNIACGMELEFHHRTAAGDIPDAPFPLARHDHNPGKHKNHLNSLVASPFIEDFELDQNDPAQGCYEFKISQYRPVHGRGPRPIAPSTAARATSGIRHLAETKLPELAPGTHAQFDSTDRAYAGATAGIHVNASLWDGAGGTNRTSEVNVEHSVAMQKLLFPLVVESSEALQRFGRNRTVATEFRWSMDDKFGNSLGYRVIGEGENERIEDRLAGADADPALAALVTVCGIYWSLAGKGAVPLDPAIAECRTIPNRYEEYAPFLAAMEQSGTARELLGDALFNELTQLRRAQYDAMLAKAEAMRTVEGTVCHEGQLNAAAPLVTR